MSEDSHFDHEIIITPPLTWRECRATPATDDAELRIDERVEDGDNGQTRILTAPAIVAKKFAHGPQLSFAIQAIIDAHPGHEFAGYIEEWVEIGYRTLPRRHMVQDRQVVTVEAVWPDEQYRPAPKRMHADELAALLRDMADRVPAGDSFEGRISYEIGDVAAHEFDVEGMYRIGNRMGQGGMRVIRGDEPTA
jgi:hypothetical protein